VPKQYKPAASNKPRHAQLPAFVRRYSDSSFAVIHDITKSDEPVFDPDAFTIVGKEMDGFESRRFRRFSPVESSATAEMVFNPDAHDVIDLRLKNRAKIFTIEISTEWFTGNQVQEITVTLFDEVGGEKTVALDRQPLKPDQKHFFEVNGIITTDARVQCYPDGGIARIRFYGEAMEPLDARENILERAKISNVSNDHYGTPQLAVSGKRQVEHMYGWESARTGFGEQALFTLDRECVIDEIVVDTYRHWFNAAPMCAVFGAKGHADELMKNAPRWALRFADGSIVVPPNLRDYMANKNFRKEKRGNEPFNIFLQPVEGSAWQAILPSAILERDSYNRFRELRARGPFNQLLFLYFPNGGIHGLKVFAS